MERIGLSENMRRKNSFITDNSIKKYAQRTEILFENILIQALIE